MEAFVKAQTPTQLFAKGPTYRGHILSPRVNERWALAVIDFTAEPDGRLKYVLLAHDIHSRKIWAKALAEKRPAEYIEALRGIMRQAGKPKELNFDGELDNPQVIRFLSASGVQYRVKEGKQDLGVLDASMRALKKNLKHGHASAWVGQMGIAPGQDCAWDEQPVQAGLARLRRQHGSL